MNDNRYEALYCRVHDYVTLELEGAATPHQRRDFADLIGRDEQVQRIYIAYMQELTSLRWSYANGPLDLLDHAMQEALTSEVATVEPRRVSRTTSEPWWTMAGFSAALIAVVIGSWHVFDRGSEPSIDRAAAGQAVATITRMIDAKWTPGTRVPTELSRLHPGQTLELTAGQVELLFDTGVEVILEGQTHFEIRSAGSAFSQRGSISARVGEEAHGFTIETPSARVIDLGTEFGVTISESGETEVAVFRGIVDLALDASADDKPTKSVTQRLNQGEALLVGNNGEFHRVFAIASDRFPSSSSNQQAKTGRPPLFSDVRDNLRDPESKKFYKIVRGGLHEDAPAFVDRNHQWNGVDRQGLPAELLGAEYIMPFNDDKHLSSRLELTLFVARPITLYVFLSDAVDTPDWLVQGDFVDTGKNIGLDEGPSRWHPASTGRRELAVGAGQSIDTIFSIWKRVITTPSEVVVSGVDRPDDVAGFNLYGIAAAPLE